MIYSPSAIIIICGGIYFTIAHTWHYKRIDIFFGRYDLRVSLCLYCRKRLIQFGPTFIKCVLDFIGITRISLTH